MPKDYLSPAFDLLIRATEQLSYPASTASGQALFKEGDRSFESTVISFSQTVQKFALECEDGQQHFYATNMGRYGSIAPVFKASSSDGSWSFEDGFLAEMSRGKENSATIHFRKRRDTFAVGTPAAAVSLYTGRATGIDFPNPVPVPPGMTRPWFLERALRCRIFGREALIRRIEMPELAEYGSTIAIAWMGEPFSDNWLRALRILLSFILGAWMEPVLNLTVDGDGRLLQSELLVVHGPSSRKATPPIQLFVRTKVQDIGDQFDDLLRHLETLLSRGVPVDVSLGHLFADHDGVDVELRDISLALDSIIESSLFETPRRLLINQSEFIEIKESIMVQVKTLLGGRHEDFEKRVTQVLELAKHDATGDRRRKFWTAVGFDLTDCEKKALKHRDSMSHKGFISFDYDDDTQWRLISSQSGLLRTLVNRVILALLGFRGSATSYVDGSDVSVKAGTDPDLIVSGA